MSKAYYTEIQVQAHEVSTEQFEANYDAIADALYACTGVTDADFASNSAELVYTFSMVVENEDTVEALRTALDVTRTALHAAGGATPGWDDHYHLLRHLVETQKNAELIAA